MRKTMENCVDARKAILDMFDLSDAAMKILFDNRMFDNWFDAHGSFKEMFPVEEFRAKYMSGDIGNFVYYRPARMVFSTLTPYDHSEFMAGLYNLKQLGNGRSYDDVCDYHTRHPRLDNMFSGAFDGQDQYLIDGLGCYQSSCGRHMLRHQNLFMDGQEKMIFKDLAETVYNW